MSKKQTIEVGGIQIKEFTIAFGQIAEEKGISEDKILETVELALAAAYKKDYGKRGQYVKAQFSKDFGQVKFFLVRDVVDETTRTFFNPDEEEKENKSEEETLGQEETIQLPYFNSERDITLEEAKKIQSEVKVGDVLEIELEAHDTFGRVAAQTAKQIIVQKIREAERESMFAEFKSREGELINGIIQRIEGKRKWENAIFEDLAKEIDSSEKYWSIPLMIKWIKENKKKQYRNKPFGIV